MADTHEPKNSLIVLYAILSSFILVLTLLGVPYYFDRVRQNEFHAKVELAPTPELRDLRDRENQLLHQYAYADERKTVARIPIERAIELEARAPWRLDARLSETAHQVPMPVREDGATTHADP